MVKIKIICKNSYCGRKTTVLTRVNFIESEYFCPICGHADTKIIEMKWMEKTGDCKYCRHSAKYQIGDEFVCRRHISRVLDSMFKTHNFHRVEIHKLKIYKAHFKIPKTGGTLVVSNNTIKKLEPAIQELKDKGLIFVKKNWWKSEK